MSSELGAKKIFSCAARGLTVCRRLIGRRFEDETVKKDVQSWPFKVIDQGGNPVVQVEYLGETKTFSPQEISAMVLVKVCIHPFPFQGHAYIS